MVTLHRASGWKVALYAKDHGPPHFHLEGPDYRCTVTIATLAVVIGSAPRPALRAALEWAAQNRALLENAWQELNP